MENLPAAYQLYNTLTESQKKEIESQILELGADLEKYNMIPKGTLLDFRSIINLENNQLILKVSLHCVLDCNGEVIIMLNTLEIIDQKEYSEIEARAQNLGEKRLGWN